MTCRIPPRARLRWGGGGNGPGPRGSDDVEELLRVNVSVRPLWQSGFFMTQLKTYISIFCMSIFVGGDFFKCMMHIICSSIFLARKLE